MTQDPYPHYHSLTHKFIQLKNQYVNIDEVISIDDVSDVAQGAYGLNVKLTNGTTVPVICEDKEDYEVQMAALEDLILAAKNPSLPSERFRTPAFAAVSDPQVTPPAGTYQKIIHPSVPKKQPEVATEPASVS